MRIGIASFFTIGIMFSLLIAFFLAIGVFFEALDITTVVVMIIIMNFLMWLIGPMICDFIYSRFHKIEWVDIHKLRRKCPKAANVVENICREYNFSLPKLGIIQDSNPTALTYGSGRWNSRIISSKGLFEYLNANEVAAVYAHEMGHITNRDFIIMTIANTVVSIFYVFYSTFLRMAERSDRAAHVPFALAAFALVFYVVSQYFLLYLSRLREYYADRFAGEKTNPNHLSTALVKIAYGIINTRESKDFINLTKNMGIMSSDASNDKGMLYSIVKDKHDFTAMKKSFIFDIKNPWAKISEINSTHPLIGNRVERLSKMTNKPVFDIKKYLRENPVNKKKMYSMFFKDFFVWSMPILAIIAGILMHFKTSLNAIGLGVLLFGLAIVFRSLYKYNPWRKSGKNNVLGLMSDVYASPMRGKVAELDGKFIGKGHAGSYLASNLQFKDKSGMIFSDYKHIIPVLGDLKFAVADAPKYINKKAKITGWFFRGSLARFYLSSIKTDRWFVKSHPLKRNLIMGIIIILYSLLFLIPQGIGLEETMASSSSTGEDDNNEFITGCDFEVLSCAPGSFQVKADNEETLRLALINDNSISPLIETRVIMSNLKVEIVKNTYEIPVIDYPIYSTENCPVNNVIIEGEEWSGSHKWGGNEKNELIIGCNKGEKFEKGEEVTLRVEYDVTKIGGLQRDRETITRTGLIKAVVEG